MEKDNKSGNKFTIEQLILELQKKAIELGRTPNVKEMKSPSYRVYYRRFGSWQNALEEAGLNMVYKKYSKEELIKIIQEKAKELNRTPFTSDIKEVSPNTFVSWFGSWNDALVAAGFEPNVNKGKYKELKEKEKVKRDDAIKYSKCEVCGMKSDGIVMCGDEKIMAYCNMCKNIGGIIIPDDCEFKDFEV